MIEKALKALILSDIRGTNAHQSGALMQPTVRVGQYGLILYSVYNRFTDKRKKKEKQLNKAKRALNICLISISRHFWAHITL
jgi:hypothetical protein